MGLREEGREAARSIPPLAPVRRVGVTTGCGTQREVGPSIACRVGRSRSDATDLAGRHRVLHVFVLPCAPSAGLPFCARWRARAAGNCCASPALRRGLGGRRGPPWPGHCCRLRLTGGGGGGLWPSAGRSSWRCPRVERRPSWASHGGLAELQRPQPGSVHHLVGRHFRGLQPRNRGRKRGHNTRNGGALAEEQRCVHGRQTLEGTGGPGSWRHPGRVRARTRSDNAAAHILAILSLPLPKKHRTAVRGSRAQSRAAPWASRHAGAAARQGLCHRGTCLRRRLPATRELRLPRTRAAPARAAPAPQPRTGSP